MARAALARMASAKSTLVAGEAAAAAAAAAAAQEGGARGSDDGAAGLPRALGAFQLRGELPRPADSTTRAPEAAGRPRLALAQRGRAQEEEEAARAARPAAAPAPRALPERADGPPAEPVEWKRGGGDAGRPRLALAPRSRPLDDAPSAAAPSKAASIFGAAKPREEVLRGRGVEPSSLDSAGGSYGGSFVHSRPLSAAVAAGGAGDEWHTVGKARRGGAGGEGGALALEDPLLSSSRPVAVGAPRSYGGAFDSGYHGGSGSYGSFGSYSRQGAHFPQGRGAEGPAAPRAEEPEEPGVFRRALPTRSGLF
jgi:hypothetical protein